MSKEEDAFNPLAKYQQVEKFDSDMEEDEEEEVSCQSRLRDVFNESYIDIILDIIHYS
jgi:hypothetical protein